MSDLDFKAKVLIVGSGVTALISSSLPSRSLLSLSLPPSVDFPSSFPFHRSAAKTLLDDGYSNLEIVTAADRVGGVWAAGPWGGVYPSLLVSSTFLVRGDVRGCRPSRRPSAEFLTFPLPRIIFDALSRPRVSLLFRL